MTKLAVSQRIRHKTNPDWGLGELLDVSHPSGLSAFFEWAGERCTINPDDVLAVHGDAANSVILNAFRIHGLRQASHSVYVIELNRAVLGNEAFRVRNPLYDPNRPCVYVGSTGLAVEQRFRNHKQHHLEGAFVFSDGERLLYELFEDLNPRRWEVAVATEFELAQKLRNDGYGVWQA